jgi:uncharacterized protein
MKTAVSIVLAAGLSTLALAAPAAAYETIDCDRDHRPAERVICGSQKLQILDAKITEAYADLMQGSELRARTKRGLISSQRAFLELRDSCGWDRACVEEVMSLRLSRIQFH